MIIGGHATNLLYLPPEELMLLIDGEPVEWVCICERDLEWVDFVHEFEHTESKHEHIDFLTGEHFAMFHCISRTLWGHIGDLPLVADLLFGQ
jgi:hypothetical protein